MRNLHEDADHERATFGMSGRRDQPGMEPDRPSMASHRRSTAMPQSLASLTTRSPENDTESQFLRRPAVEHPRAVDVTQPCDVRMLLGVHVADLRRQKFRRIHPSRMSDAATRATTCGTATRRCQIGETTTDQMRSHRRCRNPSEVSSGAQQIRAVLTGLSSWSSHELVVTLRLGYRCRSRPRPWRRGGGEIGSYACVQSKLEKCFCDGSKVVSPPGRAACRCPLNRRRSLQCGTTS
jgi:hypothetical protein